MTELYTIRLFAEEDGWIAQIQEVDIRTQGDTREQALTRIGLTLEGELHRAKDLGYDLIEKVGPAPFLLNDMSIAPKDRPFLAWDKGDELYPSRWNVVSWNQELQTFKRSFLYGAYWGEHVDGWTELPPLPPTPVDVASNIRVHFEDRPAPPPVQESGE